MNNLLQDFIEYFPQILGKGFTVALPITLISFVVGLVIAVFVAVIQTYPGLKVAKTIARIYVWIFRSTPLIVQLYVAFFGMDAIFSNAWFAAIIVLSLNVGAYASQSVRGAIMSVSKNQYETGLSTGMTDTQVFHYLILPQSIPVSIPPLSNSFMSLFKDTALVSTITIVDPFLLAQQIGAQNFHTFNLLIIAAIMYMLFISIFDVIQNILEKKFVWISQV